MAQFLRKSRLERKADEQITRKTIILGLVTVLFLVFLVVVGLPLLVRFAVFLGDMKSKNASVATDITLPPLAPRLFISYDATNSATISISGTAEPNTSVELMKNDVVVTKIDASPNGDFTVDNVTLDKGNNKFTAVAISDKGVRSTISKDTSVTYDDTPPVLSVTQPNSDTITVDTPEYDITGTSEKGVSVMVNDRMAMVDDTGKFTLRVELSPGNNDFTVTSTDLAGNQTSKKVSITYNN